MLIFRFLGVLYPMILSSFYKLIYYSVNGAGISYFSSNIWGVGSNLNWVWISTFDTLLFRGENPTSTAYELLVNILPPPDIWMPG